MQNLIPPQLRENILKLETKERIMEVAKFLFARKGLEGTSIRELARLAEVNVAAINYHFQSKQNLYQAVFTRGHQYVQQLIQERFQGRDWGLKETVLELYHLLSANGLLILTHFKMALDDNEGLRQENLSRAEFQISGPPGEDLLLQTLKRELGPLAPEEDCLHAVKTISIHLFHMVLMEHSLCKEIVADPECFSPTRITEHLDKLTTILLGHLQRGIGSNMMTSDRNPLENKTPKWNQGNKESRKL